MYAINFAQVGANIRTALESKGMTQQSLADALSVSRQVMSKIVNGTKAINVSELSRIATILGTTVDSLLTVGEQAAQGESLAFMGELRDDATREKVRTICAAIDEIRMLEELIDE